MWLNRNRNFTKYKHSENMSELLGRGTREVLETIPYSHNSNDFVFDTEFLAQTAYYGFRIGDIPIPTRYFDETSSINFIRSIKYGFQTLLVMAKYLIQKTGLFNFKIFSSSSAID